MKYWYYPVIILFFIFSQLCLADYPRSIIDTSDNFRPVYSDDVTGNVSPEKPLLLKIDIRDDYTALVKIYAWDKNGTNLTLSVCQGDDFNSDSSKKQSITGEFPSLTLKDQSGKWLSILPGNYTAMVSGNGESGELKVRIFFVYLVENVDKGKILNQTWSSKEINIPEGLDRVFFITESVSGTDLDLFIQKGTDIPGKFENFTWASTRSGSYNGLSADIGSEVSESIVISSPKPGKYLMVTRASSENDFFFTYWMGLERDPALEEKINNTSLVSCYLNGRADTEKYAGLEVKSEDHSSLSY